ncbi:MAG: hypothetical protein M3O15_13600, partial [Acidobacteriota bacterium]|nr:hypothetical protein [Acidobacteriota bacterium]
MAVQLDLFSPQPSESSAAVTGAASGQVLVTPGPLAAEEVLLEMLEGLLREVRARPALLIRPVRIVVPSRSLRLHLSALLVRRPRRAVAGLSIQTLYGLASEVLERAGEPLPRGAVLLDVIAARLGRAV